MDYVEAGNYDRGMWLLERFSLFRLRRELLRKASGIVLEIGAGTGANLPFYPSETMITAIDMRPVHLAAATKKARSVRRKGTFTAGCADAQDLPFSDNTFDAVVGTLVFCSIHQPSLALAEIARVLVPGGRLLLLEHVRGQTSLTRRITDWLHPFWFALQGECHLNRDTAATVANSGFHIDRTSVHGRGILQLIEATNPA
ncbi:MAG: class I SAM-dependent methyltransferase [Chloroflexota bacterium]